MHDLTSIDASTDKRTIAPPCSQSMGATAEIPYATPGHASEQADACDSGDRSARQLTRSLTVCAAARQRSSSGGCFGTVLPARPPGPLSCACAANAERPPERHPLVCRSRHTRTASPDA